MMCWNCKIREYVDEQGVLRCPLPACRVLEQDDPARTRVPTAPLKAPVKRTTTKPKEKA